MSTTRYLILTTLWAALLPAMILSTPILALACVSPAILFAGPVLALVIFLFYRYGKFWQQFSQAAKDGQIPANFSLRILPFFLPLFYVLLLAAIGFYLEPTQKDSVLALFMWGLPQYFPVNAVNLLFRTFNGGRLENLALAPLVASAFPALIGTIYVFRLAPPPKFRMTGLVFMLAVTFLLGHAAYHFQQRYRANLLGLDRFVTTVNAETNLHEYQPFKKDNKLVKIENPTLTIESNHPVIDGATALYPVYAAAAEAIYRNTAPEQYSLYRNENLLVWGSTTPVAFDNLLAGKVDLVIMARPSPAQLKKAEEQGKTLTLTPIGREAFVFFVSKDNPVKNLTTEQIRNIYSKRITNWAELGGKNEKILAFQRPDGSGSQTAMQRFMGTVPMTEPLQEEFIQGMGGIVKRVADYRNYGNSIGYSFRYYVEGMLNNNRKHDGDRVAVRLLSVDGVAPTVENIRNNSTGTPGQNGSGYPFTGEVVVITAGTQNPNVPKLIDWFLSPQGQDLLERVGYVPLVEGE